MSKSEQTDIYVELGVDIPTPAPRPVRRCGSRPRWTPTRATLACADCYTEQHDAATSGQRIPHRHRVTWVLRTDFGTWPLCTRHAAARGCVRAGGAL